MVVRYPSVVSQVSGSNSCATPAGQGRDELNYDQSAQGPKGKKIGTITKWCIIINFGGVGGEEVRIEEYGNMLCHAMLCYVMSVGQEEEKSWY